MSKSPGWVETNETTPQYVFERHDGEQDDGLDGFGAWQHCMLSHRLCACILSNYADTFHSNYFYWWT